MSNEDGPSHPAAELPTPEEQREERRTRLIGFSVAILSVAIFLALRILDVRAGFAMLPVVVAGAYIYLRVAPKLSEYRPHFEALTVDEPGRSWLSTLPSLLLAIVIPVPMTFLIRTGFSNLSGQGQGLLIVAGIVGVWIVVQEVNKVYGHENLLWRAAMHGNLRAVRRLLAVGANPNELDPNGNPVLVWPVVNANRKLLVLLLEAGARPDATVYAKRKGELVQVTLRELALNSPGAVPNSGRRSLYTEVAMILQQAERSSGGTSLGTDFPS